MSWSPRKRHTRCARKLKKNVKKSGVYRAWRLGFWKFWIDVDSVMGVTSEQWGDYITINNKMPVLRGSYFPRD